VGVVWGYFCPSWRNVVFLGLGCLAVAIAVVLNSLAYAAQVHLPANNCAGNTWKPKAAKKISS